MKVNSEILDEFCTWKRIYIYMEMIGKKMLILNMGDRSLITLNITMIFFISKVGMILNVFPLQ